MLTVEEAKRAVTEAKWRHESAVQLLHEHVGVACHQAARIAYADLRRAEDALVRATVQDTCARWSRMAAQAAREGRQAWSARLWAESERVEGALRGEDVMDAILAVTGAAARLSEPEGAST